MNTKQLFSAIEKGDDVAVASALVDDPQLATTASDTGLTPLMFACYAHQWGCVESLRATHPGLDPFEAAAVGQVERIRTLLAADPAVVHAQSNDGFTPLHLACYFGRVDVAAILLASGADVNAVAAGGSRLRPLHSAVAARSALLVQLCIDHGADVNAQQAGGWTALQAAAKHGDETLVAPLLAAGASAETTADSGETAIDLARGGGHTTVVNQLQQADR